MKLNQRKVLFIDPAFQKKFLIYTSGIAVAISLFYFSAVTLFFWKFKQKGLSLGLAPNHIFFRFLDDQKATMDILFIVVTILIVIMIVFYGLYMSNRISGPIYAAKKYLRESRVNPPTRQLKFRENDFFNELAEEINLTIQNKKGGSEALPPQSK